MPIVMYQGNNGVVAMGGGSPGSCPSD